MAFKPSGSLDPHGGPVLRKSILGNTVTFTESDSLKASSGFLVLGTAGALVHGHIDGIVTKSGVGVTTSGASGAAIGSFVGTFLTASDNQTVAKVSALCDVSKNTLYSAEVSATIGTTTGSNLLGYTLDLTDEDTLDETTALTTTGQYMNWGTDPADSTKAFVNIFESQVFGV